jgi:ribonuclease Z
MTATKRVLIIASVTFVAVMVYTWGHSDGRTGRTVGFAEVAFAAESPPKVSPVKARPRDTYYPNSEDLAKDEMRVIACGTGMPTTRAAQAAACFLVELGNGDKFIFDIGTGAAERISSLQIPYDYLDKIFIGHLHADHFGSLGEIFIGGALMGRQKPLRVWGPNGPTPQLGTAYAVQKMKEMYTWDLAGRVGIVDFRGYSIEVNEFDYKAENAVIYEDNGVNPFVPRDPCTRRTGQLQPRMERAEVRLWLRHVSQQVVRGVRQGRGPRHPRVFRGRSRSDQ